MLDLTCNPVVVPSIRNVQAAYNLRDRVQLEQDAQLALRAAYLVRDERGIAIATLFLALARRDLRLAKSAALSFELCRDWYNAAVALCACSELEQSAARRLALFHKALGHIERAKRQLAQAGNTDRWQQAHDVEQAIHAAVGRAADGRRWLDVS